MGSLEDKSIALFQLKADFFPMTVIKLNSTDTSSLKLNLEDSITKAPKYLVNAPVVIDTSDIEEALQQHIDFHALRQLLKDKQVIPVGIRGLNKKHHDHAIAADFAIMATGRSPNLAEGNPISAAASVKKEAEKLPIITTKIISRPVRSGTQVYARDTDLIILSAVNAGAECLADGNIHVYGPLRGRALAGANGNKEAHIFCESLEAELIAIAGQYLTKDQIKLSKIKSPLIHIFLKDNKLQIEGI